MMPAGGRAILDPHVRRVLELPAYRRLLAAYALNEIAYSIGSLALALLVYRRTGSAIAAASYFIAAQFLPALIAPALVARLDSRPVARTLPVIYALEAVAFALLAWLAGRFSLPAVLAAALADGILALIARALARAATVAVTSPVGLLREGAAVANGAFSLSFMTGPALGGAIVAAGGTTDALLTNAALFGVIALTLVSASGLPDASRHPAAARRLRGALNYALRSGPIRALLGLQAFAVLCFSISIPVEVVYATHTLHAGASGFGLLSAIWGAGAVVGSAVYARLHGLHARWLICVGAAALAVGMGVMAVAPELAIALLGAALAGCGNGIEAVAARTALQEQTDASWMALMMSLNDSVMQAVPGLGILIGGGITSLANPRVALAVAAVGSGAITFAGWALLSPRMGDQALA